MKSIIDIPKIQQRTFKISDICDVIKGNTPTMKAIPGKYPLVVTAENRKTCENYQFDCEAVCVPLVSSTGHGHADIKRIHYQNGKFALANIMVAIVPKDDKTISTKYLFHLFNTKKDEILVSLMRGTANVTLKIPQIENIMISLPSINEQKMIVSKIEKFNIELSTITQLLQKTDIQLRHWKQSFTSYALGGKQHEGLDNSKMSETIQIPKGWNIEKLSKLIDDFEKRNPTLNPNKVFKYVEIGSVSEEKKIQDFKTIIGKNAPSRARNVIRENDIIYGVTRPYYRNVVLITKEFDNEIATTGFCVLRIKNSILLSKYLFYYMLSDLANGQILGPMRGHYPAVSNKNVIAIDILLPPLSTQKKIIQKLDQIFSLTEYSKNIIKSQFSLLETIEESFLKKYFQVS